MAAPSIPDGLDELRDLLVAPERKEIAALRARIEDPALRAKDLATGLPASLGRAAARTRRHCGARTRTLARGEG